MQTTTCQNCAKAFRYQPCASKGRYCGYKCYWQSKKKDSTLHLHFGLYATKGHDLVWNKGIEVDRITHPNMGAWKKNRTKDVSNENHHAWKGDKVSYAGVHRWIQNHLGMPKECQFCGKEKNRIAWANKDHKYSRNKEDWLRLCPKCHAQYDKTMGLRFTEDYTL